MLSRFAIKPNAKNCAICGQIFFVRYGNQATCSRACGLQWRDQNKKIKWRGIKKRLDSIRRSNVAPASTPFMTVSTAQESFRICASCGISLIKKNQRYFCSRSCWQQWLTQHLPMCVICQQERVQESKYLTCSQACGYILRRLQFGHPKNCKQCGEAFWPERAPRGRKEFCSKQCSGDWHVEARHPNWRGGKEKSRGPQWERRSRQIRERDHHKCRRCGVAQSDVEQPFAVDHILPWKCFENKETANEEMNLATLCGRCHGIKTFRIERALAGGDVQQLHRHIDILSQTGPVPSPEQIGHAFARLRVLLEASA